MRKSVEPVSNISMVKTMTEAFASASPLQALALFVVLLAIAVAAIQLGRVTTWSVRGSMSEGAARLSARAARVALSTRGLARAAVWLTCAAGAVGLSNALILIANTNDPTLLVRQHLQALETSAVGLALCALLFSASLAVDLIAARMRRRGTDLSLPLAQVAGETPLLALLRRSPGLIALLMISHLLLDTRPASFVVSPGGRSFTPGAFEMLDRFWLRLAAVLTFVGVLTWLSTLIESAILRGRLSPAEQAEVESNGTATGIRTPVS